MTRLSRNPTPITRIVDPRSGIATRDFVIFIEELIKRVGGTGDKTTAFGPASSTDNAIARYDGTAGGSLQDSGVTIDDSDNIVMPAGKTVDGRDVSADGDKLDDIDRIRVVEASFTAAGLSGGADVTLFSVDASEGWKLREMFISGDGTDFTGGSGNRDISIGDGTVEFSVIPASQLGSLVAHRWGDSELPFPTTAADLINEATQDIVATYSGGSNDFTAGEATVILTLERTT